MIRRIEKKSIEENIDYITGRSAVWLARLVRDQEVGGSNPPGPKIAPLSRGVFLQKKKAFSLHRVSRELEKDMNKKVNLSLDLF